MVSRHTALIFGIAGVCGLAAVFVFNRPREEAGVRVAIASANAGRGAVLTREMIRIEYWPSNAVVSGLHDEHADVVDRCVLHPIEAGEPILEFKLAPLQAGSGLHSMIPSGMRAFTIKTTDTAGVAGFVLPGSRVDVLLNMLERSSSSHKHGGGITITLLQNVEVLAVAQQLEAPSENRVDLDELKSVTLLVTPHQAAKLNVAISKGTLHLALRNPQDAKELEPPQATLAELVSHRRPVSLVAAPNPPQKSSSASQAANPIKAEIWTLRGTSRGRVQILHTRSSTIDGDNRAERLFPIAEAEDVQGQIGL